MWWPNISWTFFDVSCIKMQFCVMNNTCWTHFHAYSQKTGIQKDADAPFVPTVTAVASAPDLKWMVLSTDISSVSPCRQEKTQSSSHSTDAKPARKTFTSRRKGVKDQVNTFFEKPLHLSLAFIFDLCLSATGLSGEFHIQLASACIYVWYILARTVTFPVFILFLN